MKVALFDKWVRQNVFNEKGKLNPRASSRMWWEKKNAHHILEDIDNAVSGIPFESFNEKIYCYLNGIATVPFCAGCKEHAVRFDRGAKKYSTYCSQSCASKFTNDKKLTTMIQRYGQIKNFSSEEHRKHVSEVCIEKYGIDDPNQTPSIKEKIKNSHVEKFGSHYTQTPDYHEKRLATSLSRYGESSHMKLDSYRNQARLLNLKLTPAMELQIINDYTSGVSKQQVSKNVGLSISHLNKVLVKLGLDTDLPQNKIAHISKQSQFELEVLSFVQRNYSGIVETSKRKYIGTEIDIFLPELQLGIECNGTYWHSDHYKDRNYHLDKTNAAEAAGIQLLHITDYDWFMKKHIIENTILSKLNLLSNVVYARKCKVIPVSSAVAGGFEEIYHIQGSRTSKHRLGLYAEDQLCAVMTFNQFRDGVEIVRYASSMSVPGGFSKLLSHSGFNIVYSYANRSFTSSKSNVYLTNGFVEIERTNPNYAYYKGSSKLARTSAMKSKLGFLKEFDSSLSESQNMYNNGYHRMWDSGNLLYKFEVKLEH